jgi:AcrR family transcriptional regulator
VNDAGSMPWAASQERGRGTDRGSQDAAVIEHDGLDRRAVWFSDAMDSTLAASPLAWQDYSGASLPRILQAALDAFVERGYHGTSTRDIARGCGLSIAGLYHHFPSKQDILVALLGAVMDDLLQRSRAALESAGPHPVRRFDALLESLLRFHMMRRDQAFVASTEGRSLNPEHRIAFIARRDEQQQLIEDVICEGIAAGHFATPYPHEAARAIATLCVGVSTWYRPDGPLSPNELIDRHLMIARDIARSTEPNGTAATQQF